MVDDNSFANDFTQCFDSNDDSIAVSLFVALQISPTCGIYDFMVNHNISLYGNQILGENLEIRRKIKHTVVNQLSLLGRKIFKIFNTSSIS